MGEAIKLARQTLDHGKYTIFQINRIIGSELVQLAVNTDTDVVCHTRARFTIRPGDDSSSEIQLIVPEQGGVETIVVGGLIEVIEVYNRSDLATELFQDGGQKTSLSSSADSISAYTSQY